MANIAQEFAVLRHLEPEINFDDMFKELLLLRDLEPEINFDDMFKEFPVLRDLESMIMMDVLEDEKAYTVRAEIPGATKEDIKVA